MMPYKPNLTTAILLAGVCLIQRAIADGYEGLCVAALESNDFNNKSTTKCCEQILADLDDTIPLYVTCANMSEDQLNDFTECCPTMVHVDSKSHHGKGKSKNEKRDTSKRIRRNSKRRNDCE
ncbi:hypothetical protein BGZ91_002496 [Linnemannia elongata]|nr:hypothetical protein BGZ91_002496 [Linnemannia elongata]